MPPTEIEPLPRPAAQSRVSERYIPALDGIRGLAILLVLFHHFRFLLEPIHRSQHVLLLLADGGWCGVELFFVLSGFLITGILLDTRESPRFFRTFYARRVLRIFPVYFLYLAVVMLVLSRWWTLRRGFNPWVQVNCWPYFLYLENFKSHHMFNDLLLGHLWSLAVEEQFYLVWPLVVALSPRRVLAWAAALLVLVAVIYRFEMAGKSLELSFYVNTFTVASLDSLALGALSAILLRSKVRMNKLYPTIAVTGLASFALFVAFARHDGGAFLYYRFVHVWGVLALSIGSACLILWCATHRVSVITRFLAFRPLRSVGKVSYGMYVWHPVVIAFLAPHVHPMPPGLPPLAQTGIKLIIMGFWALATYLLAMLSWVLFESQILRLKSCFRY
jgi:peptidoglycan/LPS O-acetylase OafA/YrhL